MEYTEPSREISLDGSNAVDKDLLVPPSQRSFGGSSEIEFERIRLRIGERPLASNLRRLYELAGRETPTSLEVFTAYEIWLVTHHLSVIQEGGFKSVRQLGYQMRFDDHPKVSVVETLPQTRFVTKVGAKFKHEADIELSGHASTPPAIHHLLSQVESVAFGAKLVLTADVNLVGRLSFSVMTPVIQSVGAGDNTSEWVFTRYEEPLVGTQPMVQIILTPRRQKRLAFRARAYAVISTPWWAPLRLQSDWIDLSCSLV